MHISRSSIDRCEYSTQHNNSHSSFSQSMNEKWARMQSSRVEIEQNLNKHNSIEDSELPTHFPASLNNCCCVCRNYRQLFALDGEWNGNKMFSLTINRHSGRFGCRQKSKISSSAVDSSDYLLTLGIYVRCAKWSSSSVKSNKSHFFIHSRHHRYILN